MIVPRLSLLHKKTDMMISMTVCGIVLVLNGKKTREKFGVSVVTLLYRFSLISSLVFTVIADLLGVFMLTGFALLNNRYYIFYTDCAYKVNKIMLLFFDCSTMAWWLMVT